MATPTDRRPPVALVNSLSLVLRRLLPSPLGRLLPKLALIEVRGRRSGRLYRVVAGWYESAGGASVFTPARWRTNFESGALADVWNRGRRQTYRGVLVSDPDAVARELNATMARGTSAQSLGLKVAAGAQLTGEDIRRLDRAFVRFDAPGPSESTPAS